MIKIKKIKAFIVIVCFLVFMPLISEAKSYDYYVDSSVSKGGDGSKEKPFKTITEAMKKNGDIFIENGKYKENIELEKRARLFGESENGVVISGKIIMNDDTKIQDLTVRGARKAILIKKDADAEIENCTVKDFGKIGIKSISGSGKLKVIDSKIKNGNGKGFYIERGKLIEFSNNEITENKEEGIDIRSKVSGVIKNNIIIGNGESGIELIVGSANLQIENNTIKRNGSSGIATQFYPERESRGQVNINDNSIGENNKYGLDCNRPQGGSPGKSYWRDSIELAKNNIYANKIKSINDYCNLIDAVDEDEKADNMIEDSGYENETYKEEAEDERVSEISEEEIRQIEMEEEAERQEKEKKMQEIEILLEKQEFIGKDTEENINELKNEGKIKNFFLGINLSKIDDLMVKLNEREQLLEKMIILMEEVDMEAEEEISFQEISDNAKNEINQQKYIIDIRKKSFSLFGWVRNLFQ